MKKYTLLPLLIFIIAFGFNFNIIPAHAVECSAGQSFSTVTGEPCTSWTSTSSSLAFRIGDSGPAVVAYQQALNAAGFGPLVADGKYGPKTAAAGVRYKASVGISVTTTSSAFSLACFPLEQRVSAGSYAQVGAYATFTVSDRNPTPWAGPVSWTAAGGTPPSGSTQAFATSYSLSGNYDITVTGNGQSATCKVAVSGGASAVSTGTATPPAPATCAAQHPGDAIAQNLCQQIKTLQAQICAINSHFSFCSGTGTPQSPPPGPPGPSTPAPVPVVTNGVVGVIGIPPKYYGQNGRYVIQHSDFGFFWLDTAAMTGGHVQVVTHCGGLGRMPNSDSGRWVIADCNGTTDESLSSDGTQVVTTMSSGQCGAQKYPSCSGSRDDGHWLFAFGLGTWDYKGDYPTDPVTGSATPPLINSSRTTDPQGRHWQMRLDPAYCTGSAMCDYKHFLWSVVP